MGYTHNDEIILKSANKCCICFRTGIVCHHIKFKEEGGGNDFDNLAPLCPNCHDRAHTKSTLTRNLTKELISNFRDGWYKTVEEHKANLREIGINFEDKQVTFILKLKNFYLSASNKGCLPNLTIKIAFSEFLPDGENEELRSIQIFDYVVDGLSGDDRIKDILKKLKELYSKHLTSNKELLKEFNGLCEYFGVRYNSL